MIKITNRHNFFFILILAMLGALPPFATDTYTPAIPQLADYFSVNQSHVMLTITTYFMGFAIGILVWGPLSDFFGRKKIIIIGLTLYIISTIICSLSWSYNILVIMRFIQGFSDSSGVIISIAMARDCYSGKKLTIVMASVMIVQMLAPIVAPILGSLIIIFTNKWRNIFHFLTFYGVILLVSLFFIPETKSTTRSKFSLRENIMFYKTHLSNNNFIIKSFISGICFAGFFSFIGSSSIIFLSYYQTGYLLYCILFATNILGVMAANTLLKYKVTSLTPKQLFLYSYITLFLGMIFCFMFSVIYVNVYFFTFAIALVSFGFSLSSTKYSSDALSEVDCGIGVASSINSFIKFFFGGTAIFTMTMSSLSNIYLYLSIQQFIAVVLSLFLIIILNNIP